MSALRCSSSSTRCAPLTTVARVGRMANVRSPVHVAAAAFDAAPGVDAAAPETPAAVDGPKETQRLVLLKPLLAGAEIVEVPVPAEARERTFESRIKGPVIRPFSEVMAFNGTAPELINGRLAMLGFLSGVIAELVSGHGIPLQLVESAQAVNLAIFLVVGGSLFTAFQGVKPVAVGPFTPEAEMLNGRLAMFGFAVILAIELINAAAVPA